MKQPYELILEQMNFVQGELEKVFGKGKVSGSLVSAEEQEQKEQEEDN